MFNLTFRQDFYILLFIIYHFLLINLYLKIKIIIIVILLINKI